MTDISTTDLSRPSNCSWLHMLDAPVGESMVREVMWLNGVGNPNGRRVDYFFLCELSCWDLYWFKRMCYSRSLIKSSCFLFCSCSSYTS